MKERVGDEKLIIISVIDVHTVVLLGK